MKIVKHVGPQCDCYGKLELLERKQAEAGRPLCLGSIVECDCGQQYRLVDSQRDGTHWSWYHPDSGNMAKR